MKLQFLISILVVFFFCSCDLIGELQEEETEYVRKSQIAIGEISLFSEISDLIKCLGEPDSVSQGFYYYNGINMYVAMDSVIWEVSTTNPKFSTPDDISVGDSKEKVLEAYGETETWKHDDKLGETLVYWNYHFFQRTPLYLFISTRKDSVSEISLWFHYE